MKLKIKGSWMFIAGTAGILGAVYFGWYAYARMQLAGFKPEPIQPGRINLVAVTPGKGYRIVVANRIAQLAEVPPDSEGGRGGFGGGNIENASSGRRLPIRELLLSLQGDTKALGILIERMNDLGRGDNPFSRIVWKSSDVEKAIQGDAALRAKLVRDIQVNLDGTPIETLSYSRMLEGIAIESEVPIQVRVAGKLKTLTARVRQNYQSSLAAQMEKRLGEKFQVTEADIAGTYRDMGEAILQGAQKPEDVVLSLRSRYQPDRLQALGEKPSRVLGLANIVLNEKGFEKAVAETYKAQGDKELTDITLRLTEEGRMRLWKYSHDNRGFQLLLIVDGVAIAAPKITTELVEREVRITQLPDRTLALMAVEDMNKLAAKPGS